jgi:hypothetical protein
VTVTQQQVETWTGTTVSQNLIVQAQGLIEMFSNHTPGATATFSDHDNAWFDRAVAYQAAWMNGQPDLWTRNDVNTLSQDGLSVDYRDTEGIVLAPLAARCLRRISRWNLSLSVHTPTWGEVAGGYAIYDDAGPWKPL